MIYRFHIFEAFNKDRVKTPHSVFALNALLKALPEQLAWILDEADILTEILDLDKQESYLKVTTHLSEQTVVNAVNRKLSLTGLAGTLISARSTRLAVPATR